MKNIHVLPTDKPSRLSILNSGKLNFGAEIMGSSNSKPKHIYITSDEEIKEGDWCYQVELNDGKVDKCYDVTLYHTWTNNGVDKTRKFKKIILTTDQVLIKDGIQAIDDDFLEWFVKNPSCEEVEIDKGYRGLNLFNYKIIIPKEEPKQETLEEVAERLYPIILEDDGWDKNKQYRDEWIEGAKWQQGRMYNEEDIIEFAEWIINQDWDETELNFSNNSKSTKELLQLWKEQKPKTVYYEN